MPISTYSANHTGPNQLSGGVHSGFTSAAYQCRAADDAAGRERGADRARGQRAADKGGENQPIRP